MITASSRRAARRAWPPWPRSALALAPSAAAAPPTARSRTSRPSRGSCRSWCRCPADADVDLDGVKVTVDGKDADGHGGPRGDATPTSAAPPSWPSTPASRWRASRFEAAKDAAQEFIDLGPRRRRTSASSPSPARSPRRSTPTTDRDCGPRRCSTGSTLTKKTRLYDGVIQAVDVAGTEGQRSLLVLSDGADTSETPIDDRHHGDQGRRACSSTWSRSTQAGDGPRGPAAARRGRPGPGHLHRPGGPAGGVRRRGRRAGPPGAGHRDRCPSGFSQDRGHDQGHAADVDRLGHRRGVLDRRAGRSRSSSAPRAWTPPSWALYAGPVALGARPGAPRGPDGPAQAGAAERRRPGHPLHRDRRPPAGAPTESGPLLDADVTFASAKETAANVLRRNKDLDARISARLQGAGSELKSSEWLLVHGGSSSCPACSACCSAAATCSSASSSSWLGAVRPVDVPRVPAQTRRKAFNTRPARHPAADVRLAGAGLSLAQSVDTIVREGAEPIASRVPPGAGGDPARRVARGRPARAWPSGSRARTSTGS